MGKTLRPHQERAIEQLRTSLGRNGKRRPMLELATGAGKTVIAAAIVRMALSKGKRILFVVDALSLIDQTVERFIEDGIYEIGVIQADHPLTNHMKRVQVASVQTLRRRGMPKCDLVIIDEAHSLDKWLIATMQSDEWAKVPFIGLSATPWTKGLGNIYDDLICPVTMQQLIDDGFLCPYRVFAPTHPDLSKVEVQAGDFHEGQLAEVMGEQSLVADVVDTWRLRGDNRPTLCFCVNRAHAKAMQERFQAVGVGCGYIDAFTSAEERQAIHKQLDAGEIRVVANVGCLTKGVDWAIGCIILARPTKSEMLFVQMVGRGLRVNPGIPDCIVLDHSDNTLRMGFPTDIRKPELCTAVKGERAKSEKQMALPKECPKCTFLKPPKTRECPSCGFVAEMKFEAEEAEGELVELKRTNRNTTMDVKQEWLAGLNFIARERGYSSGWAANTYRAKFGVWPNSLNKSDVAQPSQEMRDFAKSQLIRFSKRRAAA